MIELHFWPTPNGHKITLALEKMALAYRIEPVDLGRGDQRNATFLAISPNGRMPAIVDRAPSDNGEPVTIFESGAILLYLARKSGRLGGANVRQEKTIHEWLFWQVGGLGPMSGQYHHFAQATNPPLPYAIDRYTREVARLYGVLDARLGTAPFVAGDAFTIADCAIYPWVRAHSELGGDLAPFPNVRRYLAEIGACATTQRAYARAPDFAPP